MEIKELYALYLETQEKVRNRPDAVIYVHGDPKGRSAYQRKLKRIVKYARTCVPSNQTEEVFLKTILTGVA